VRAPPLALPAVAAAPRLDPWLQVVILGIVEGLTEFLPISSTGHLLVASRALRFEGSIGGTFEIFIQLGAVLAVVGYYFRDLWDQARAVLGAPGERSKTEPRGARRFWLNVLLAFLPAAAIGLALHRWIKAALFAPGVIAATLVVGGVIFIVLERGRLGRRQPTVDDVLHVSWRQAVAIGGAQLLALVPGVSRSGASIIGGLLVGLDRRTATAFSFYLAIPTLGGATVVDLLQSVKLLGPGDLQRLAVGAGVSLVVAWLSIGWLLRYVSRRSFAPFGIYRIVAGAAVAGAVMLQWL
jgi:undecaprenyl-diphosphatase